MDRIKKARLLVQMGLTNVLSTNKNGLVTQVTVSGSQAKQYDVILRRHPGKISTECRLCIGQQGHKDCMGNLKTVCYHSVAAVIVAANAQNRKVLGVSRSEINAKRLSNIGGYVITISSWQGGTPLYAVIR